MHWIHQPSCSEMLDVSPLSKQDISLKEFWDVMLHSLVYIDILEESTASFSRVNYAKDGGGKFSEMLVPFEGYVA